MTKIELIEFLPAFNACCNGLSFLLIMAGFIAIRKKKIKLHAGLMTSAFLVSSIFLIGYLTRYYLTGPTAYQGQGFWRFVYFSVLISHSILALINVPLVISTLILGIRNKISKHKKWAKTTLPIWAYVSLTGVIIYFMLYQCKGN